MLQPERLPPAPEHQVTYRSFLLRVRRVEREEGTTQQYFLVDIRTEEESFFVDMQEMMSFFNALLSVSEEREP
jgi:hypothetical protein